MSIFNPKPVPLKRGDKVTNETGIQGVVVSPKGLSEDKPTIKSFELIQWDNKDHPVWSQTIHIKKANI